MGLKNTNLKQAKVLKNDEFYTQLVDIENEMRHYKRFFQDKIVFCNCDDPFESNFFKYFAMNFNHLGLKKLICTCYATSPVAWVQLSLFDNENIVVKTESGKQPYKIEISEVKDYNGDGAVDLVDVEYLLKNKKNTLSILDEDGDFRSQECVDLLKEADVVVTNPPFSLFREYLAQLLVYDKKFIIIGNKNALAGKELFPLLKDNKIWCGYEPFAGGMWFQVPNKDNDYDKIVNGLYMKNVPSIWYTNIDTTKRHEILPLYKSYDPEEYPSYDNYDGIDVAHTSDIPYDYFGVMGVPISFMEKYNPEQFELIGIGTGDSGKALGVKKNYRGRTDIAYTINGKHKCPFSRILIRRKNNAD